MSNSALESPWPVDATSVLSGQISVFGVRGAGWGMTSMPGLRKVGAHDFHFLRRNLLLFPAKTHAMVL